MLVDHLARKLGMAPHIFKEINFYKEVSFICFLICLSLTDICVGRRNPCGTTPRSCEHERFLV